MGEVQVVWEEVERWESFVAIFKLYLTNSLVDRTERAQLYKRSQ